MGRLDGQVRGLGRELSLNGPGLDSRLRNIVVGAELIGAMFQNLLRLDYN